MAPLSMAALRSSVQTGRSGHPTLCTARWAAALLLLYWCNTSAAAQPCTVCTLAACTMCAAVAAAAHPAAARPSLGLRLELQGGTHWTHWAYVLESSIAAMREADAAAAAAGSK
jgi:hypothetical protein